MPPKSTYVFKHYYTTKIFIQLEIYGDKNVARDMLQNYVLNVNDWYLDK